MPRSNTLKTFLLIVSTICLVGCRVFLEPKLEKFEGYMAGKKYNTHQFYSAPFEIQLADNPNSTLHIDLNYNDSIYNIQIIHSDTLLPIDNTYSGKYTIDKNGLVELTGDSPFEKDAFQIVVLRSRSSLFAEFKFNKVYAEIFTRKTFHAYCEMNFPWELQDCIVP